MFCEPVKVFNEEVLAPTAVNLVSTDAVYVANVVFFVFCEPVKVFNDEVDAPIALLIVNWDAVKALREVRSPPPPPLP